MKIYPKEEADYSESVLYDLLYKEHKLIDGFDKGRNQRAILYFKIIL